MKKVFIIGSIVIGVFILSYFAYNFFSAPKQVKESPYVKYKNQLSNTYRLGFTNLDQEITIDDLAIQGEIPEWLSGVLFRNGPAKFTANSTWVSSWFDGLAMIHAFSFNNGKVSYANKFLRSNDYKHVEKTGKMTYSGFAQDPCNSIFKTLFSLFIPKKQSENLPNANVNIAHYTDQLIALTETPLPIRFDAKTLETLGVMDYDDELPKSKIHDTAHPQYDHVRKEHLGYFTKFGKTSSHNLFRIKDGSTSREIIASIEVKEPSYMHSFFITKRYAIFTLLPLVVNPLDLLLKKKAFIKNFKWKPELGTKFVVIDRIQDKVVGTYKGMPFFAFHTVNAFEKDNSIVMDIIIYPDGSGIGKADLSTIFAEKYRQTSHQHMAEPDTDILESGQLTRFILDLDTKKITKQKLFDEIIELPRINYEQYNTKPYSYVYAYGKKHAPLFINDKLVKVNVNDGSVINWYEDHCYPGEPVFVAAPSAHSEDDGVVLSVVLDVKKELSFLLVLDAKTFTERARVYVPHHIPFGIHGLFVK